MSIIDPYQHIVVSSFDIESSMYAVLYNKFSSKVSCQNSK